MARASSVQDFRRWLLKLKPCPGLDGCSVDGGRWAVKREADFAA